MKEKLLKRSEVDRELTWKVEDIYPTNEAMLEEAEKLPKRAEELEEKYKGKLDTPQLITECMNEYQSISETIVLVSNYAELIQSVDYTDQQAQEICAKVGRLAAKTGAALSFIDTELGTKSAELLEQAGRLEPRNAGYLKKILRFKPHLLSEETEKTLAALGQTLNTPYEIYNIAKLGDMAFPEFTADGKSYPLGYSLFEDDYEYEENTQVRRAAFRAFSDKLGDYVNTTAAAYNAHVQKEKTISDLRKFPDVYSYLLHDQQVPGELYNRQIDVIMEKLAPHMRKYAALLKKVHHLDQMTYADLKLPVDCSYSPEVTIEDAKKYIREGLAIMGQDYGEMIDEAFQGRWVDFAKNIGKSTGGFCASPYGKHSYILLNWNGRMSDVFTLAHELGHAGHFKMCNAAQSLYDTEVSTYFVEAPSTMNELLMAKYLLKTNDDKRFQRWVLSNMIGNTYYHNFVTHLLEAAYQREVYRIVDAGGSVQADTLSNIMKKVLERFWGDTVELTEGCELTWMRQPHYYMGLYSYTYSAGLTIATMVADRIEKEGTPAVEDWKKVLTAGGTLTPVEFAKGAGVDITTDRALVKTIEIIGEMIDKICELTDEIDAK